MSINAYSDITKLKGIPNGYQLNLRAYDIIADGQFIGNMPPPSPSDIEFSVIDGTTGKLDIFGLTKDITSGTVLELDNGNNHLDYEDPEGNRVILGNLLVPGNEMLLNDKLQVSVFSDSPLLTEPSINILADPVQNTPGICTTNIQFRNDSINEYCGDKVILSEFGLRTINKNEIVDQVFDAAGNSMLSLKPQAFDINLPDVGNGVVALTSQSTTAQPNFIVNTGDVVGGDYSQLNLSKATAELKNTRLGVDHKFFINGGDFYMEPVPNDVAPTDFLTINPANGLISKHVLSNVKSVDLIGVGAHQFVTGGSGELDFRAMTSPLNTISFNATPTAIEMESNFTNIPMLFPYRLGTPGIVSTPNSTCYFGHIATPPSPFADPSTVSGTDALARGWSVGFLPSRIDYYIAINSFVAPLPGVSNLTVELWYINSPTAGIAAVVGSGVQVQSIPFNSPNFIALQGGALPINYIGAFANSLWSIVVTNGAGTPNMGVCGWIKFYP